MTSIIDTNVILVANGKHEDVSPDCVASCALRLQAIMAGQRIALDDAFEILHEYLKRTQPKTGDGPGDEFVKWALRNNANPKCCDLVALEPQAERGYESFPEDVQLTKFDPADRKFVAVAAAHDEHPPILQAADSKWLGWDSALKDHNVTVEFLCSKDIKRFHRKKFGK